MSFWDKFKSSDSFEYEIDNRQVIENVKKAGYEVLEADDYHLFLDIDSEEYWELFNDRIGWLQKFFGEMEFEWHPSIGGLPGRHVIITLQEPMGFLERVAWQACLGSDPKREFNNLLGYHFDMNHHIVLFNKKQEATKRRFPG